MPNTVVDSLFAAWRDAPPPAPGCMDILRSSRHGDLPRWLEALRQVPCTPAAPAACDDTVRIGAADDLSPSDRQRLDAALRALIPWRKGPFELFGVRIDAEWRSDWKWRRIAPHVTLTGRRVLDVGCGNGYYGWRMLAAGAAAVTGVEPHLLYVLQHALVAHLAPPAAHWVLPLRFEECAAREPFDVIFSLGVLYHRRDPAGHLFELARHAHRDTVLVLETLVMEGEALLAPKRYARMRNVHAIPNLDLLRRWLRQAGFVHAELVDVSATTVHEQRSTAWMPFQSLADALHPQNANLTVEGYPAPRRAVILAGR